MSSSIGDLGAGVCRGVADWIGERPETTIAVAALRSGRGRVWIDGDPAAPAGVLVESALLPGEAQGVGDGASVLRLLGEATGWSCVEVDPGLADAIGDEFERRWGIARIVVDVIHVLGEPVAEYGHPLVHPLTPSEALELPAIADDLLPDRRLVAAAAERGWFFAAVERGVIVGQGGSLAAGSVFADVGVHVGSGHRRDGIATACASGVCAALQAEGLVPVWGTSSENAASLAVACRLGFVEAARLHYFVRAT
jgi:hypothetical protein